VPQPNLRLVQGQDARPTLNSWVLSFAQFAQPNLRLVQGQDARSSLNSWLLDFAQFA